LLEVTLMDEADMADQHIQSAIDGGRARAKVAMGNPSLRPIIQVLDGTRFGICHYCESEIMPGHLFCPTDPEPEHSCAVEWEHERKRKEASGL
jgi:hypothetical protein